jgi:ABC-2 type transport system permease protein
MYGFAWIVRKEVLHVVRDRGIWRNALAIPLVQMIILGLIDLNITHAPMVVADHSRTAASRDFVQSLVSTAHFRLVGTVDGREQLRDTIVAGKAVVGVEVPADFARRLLAREEASVLILADGSDAVASTQVLAAANGAALDRSLRNLAESSHSRIARVQTLPHILFNPSSRSANLLLPALIALLPMFSASLLAAFSIVRERERGTFEQLLLTPLQVMSIILGKLVPYLVLGLLQLTLGMLIMSSVFRVPVHGSLSLLLGLALVYLVALLSLSLFVSAFSRSLSDAVQISQLLSLPSILLSGYMFPLYTLHPVLAAIGQLFPATHFISICRAVILRGAGLEHLWSDVLALLLLSAVLLAASMRVFRRTVA